MLRKRLKASMITIRDVAQKCGYSVASVSKALNGREDINVETARIIRTKANEMGYFPNAAARTLKTNHTKNIGILFVDQTGVGLTHEYFAMILNNIKTKAESLGYDITFISRNISGFSMSYLDHCRYRHCDGVVVVSVDFSDPDVMDLVRSDIPTITIDYVFDERTSILSDNAQSMRDLVKYVYGKGHRSLAFIHGEDTNVTRKRLGSFYNTCRELGVEVPEEYVKSALYHDPKSSGRATRELLDLKNRPTCIFYPDDFSYLGGMTEIEKHGLSVPDDLSVVGYDGILLSQVLRPRLTTLQQDTILIGQKAAEMLIDEIEHPKSYFPQQIVIPGKILEGDTVKEI